MRSLTFENDRVKVEVWPRLGGKVSSILDKADGFELLFNYPAEIPTEPTYGQPYDRSWYAGWDECFPAVAAGPYVGHPYDGIAIPDHGELYSVPVTTAVPSVNGITCVWNGLRFGYRFSRKLELTGTGLRASYTMVNLSPYEFRFVWAQHALLSTESEVTVDLPAASQMSWSHDASGRTQQRPFAWPILEGAGDLSRPGELPDGLAWKAFAQRPIESPAVVRYPHRRRAVRVEFAGDVSAYWGIWINTGGWNHQRHVAVEPTTGRFDQLDRAVHDDSAGRIGAGATAQWQVDWSVCASE
jgi:hypothetical protein